MRLTTPSTATVIFSSAILRIDSNENPCMYVIPFFGSKQCHNRSLSELSVLFTIDSPQNRSLRHSLLACYNDDNDHSGREHDGVSGTRDAAQAGSGGMERVAQTASRHTARAKRRRSR